MTSKIVTFFEEVGGWLKKLFTNATVEQQVLATIKYAAPIVTEIVSLIAPAAGGPVAALFTAIETRFATIATLTSGAVGAVGSTTSQTIVSELGLLKSDLGQVMTLADIKDTATQAKVQGFVDTLIGEVDAAISGLTPAPAA